MPPWQPVVLMNELQYVRYVDKDAEGDDAFTRHAFNVSSSNRIASNRPLPDTRHSRYRTGHCTRPVSLSLFTLHAQHTTYRSWCYRCRHLDWSALPLQTTSVIVAFHNEARSALLRTVVRRVSVSVCQCADRQGSQTRVGQQLFVLCVTPSTNVVP